MKMNFMNLENKYELKNCKFFCRKKYYKISIVKLSFRRVRIISKFCEIDLKIYKKKGGDHFARKATTNLCV